MQTGRIEPCILRPFEAFSGAVAMRAGYPERLRFYRREPTPTMAAMLGMSFQPGFGMCGLLSRSSSLGLRVSERPERVKTNEFYGRPTKFCVNGLGERWRQIRDVAEPRSCYLCSPSYTVLPGPGGNAVFLLHPITWWCEILSTLRQVLDELDVATVRLAFALQPYPAGQQAITDLTLRRRPSPV
jgi:hypothetical protein